MYSIDDLTGQMAGGLPALITQPDIVQPIGRWHCGTPVFDSTPSEGGSENWTEFTGQLCERLIGESVPANKWVPEAYGFIWLSGPVADGFDISLLVARYMPILIPLVKDLGKRESLGSKVLFCSFS